MKRITILIAVLAFAACEKQTAEMRITKAVLKEECPLCKVVSIEQGEATVSMEIYLYNLAGLTAPDAAFELFREDENAVVGQVVITNLTRHSVPYQLIAIYVDGEKKLHHLFAVNK